MAELTFSVHEAGLGVPESMPSSTHEPRLAWLLDWQALVMVVNLIGQKLNNRRWLVLSMDRKEEKQICNH